VSRAQREPPDVLDPGRPQHVDRGRHLQPVAVARVEVDRRARQGAERARRIRGQLQPHPRAPPLEGDGEVGLEHHGHPGGPDGRGGVVDPPAVGLLVGSGERLVPVHLALGEQPEGGQLHEDVGVPCLRLPDVVADLGGDVGGGDPAGEPPDPRPQGDLGQQCPPLSARRLPGGVHAVRAAGVDAPRPAGERVPGRPRRRCRGGRGGRCPRGRAHHPDGEGQREGEHCAGRRGTDCGHGTHGQSPRRSVTRSETNAPAAVRWTSHPLRRGLFPGPLGGRCGRSGPAGRPWRSGSDPRNSSGPGEAGRDACSYGRPERRWRRLEN